MAPPDRDDQGFTVVPLALGLCVALVVLAWVLAEAAVGSLVGR